MSICGLGVSAQTEQHVLQVENDIQAEIAAIYNSTSNTFRPFHMKEHPFCSGQTLLPNGQGIIVGGEWLNWHCQPVQLTCAPLVPIKCGQADMAVLCLCCKPSACAWLGLHTACHRKFACHVETTAVRLQLLPHNLRTRTNRAMGSQHVPVLYGSANITKQSMACRR